MKRIIKQLSLWTETSASEASAPILVDEIRKAILTYQQKNPDNGGFFKRVVLSSEASNLVANDSNAFLFGLIADQSVRVEIAWSLPFGLKSRLGYFDLEKIADLSLDELTAIMQQKPALHRFPHQMAVNIHGACLRLIEKYDGDAKTIWNTATNAKTIIKRLMEFRGIGNKKANLGLSILVSDFGIIISDVQEIDIAYDLHIRRVFSRAGLIKHDSPKEVFAVARKISPDYPSSLTAPVWLIGRTWCHAQNPNCLECVLGDNCAKQIEIRVKDDDET